MSADHGMAASGDALKDAMAENVGGVASLTRALNALVVAKEIRTAPRHDVLVRASWYPDLALMTTRMKEGSIEGFYLAIQAASNARSHGHNDSGSIIVFQEGEPLIIDVGVGTYEAKTFSKDRYTIFSMQSQFHNLPIIGNFGEHEGSHGVGPRAQRVEYRASEPSYFDKGGSTSMSANLAPAYPAEADVSRWMRTVTLDRNAGVVRLDETFQLKKPQIVALAFITPKQPIIESGNVRIGNAVLRCDPSQLVATSERIALTDPAFRHTWGEALYRILLTTPRPVSKGSWKTELHSV